MKLRDVFRIGRKSEKRSTFSVEPYLSTYGALSAAGTPVTTTSALRVAAVYACVKVIAETIASLPLYVYRNAGHGKTPARDHRLWRILHDEPNENSTSFTFRESFVASLLLSGNAYAIITGAGDERSLVYVEPMRVGVTRDPRTGRLRYTVRIDDGDVRVFDRDRIVHVPALSFNGVTGLSPLSHFMSNVVGTAIAADEHASRMLTNGARPGGVLEHPGALTEGALARLKDQIDKATSGVNTGKTLVLEEGMKFSAVAMNNEEAQFIEQRKFSVTEIARIFRVPPHMIADLERATFSNIEHQSIDFVTHTIRPWLVRIEQELTRKLTLPEEGLSIEFKIDGLLRGDIKSRNEAYAIGRNNGWLSANEVRAMENLNPIEGGDQYLVPVNMTTPARLEADADNPNDGASPNEQTGSRAARLRAI